MAEEEVEVKKDKKSKSKMLVISFMALNMLIMLAGAGIVYKYTLGYESPISSEKQLNMELDEFIAQLQNNEDVLYSLDTLTTNLNGVPRRMIRVDLSLEMMDEEGFEEIIGASAETRDTIMRILNKKAFQDIESVQGKLQLKNEIIVGVNHFLNDGVVRNVYFTELLIQ